MVNQFASSLFVPLLRYVESLLHPTARYETPAQVHDYDRHNDLHDDSKPQPQQQVPCPLLKTIYTTQRRRPTLKMMLNHYFQDPDDAFPAPVPAPAQDLAPVPHIHSDEVPGPAPAPVSSPSTPIITTTTESPTPSFPSHGLHKITSSILAPLTPSSSRQDSYHNWRMQMTRKHTRFRISGQTHDNTANDRPSTMVTHPLSHSSRPPGLSLHIRLERGEDHS
jgi:hypothetical protein